MKQVEVHCRGVRCGEAMLREDGMRVEVRVQMRDPRDGLYRAVLEGEQGEWELGVMEPKDGDLLLRRRPLRSEIERMGTVQRVRAVCICPFGGKKLWNRTEEVTQLFRGDFLRQRLAGQPRAWYRQDKESLVMALPLKKDAPFPLEALFCFACVEWVENELCAVFAFDGREMPFCAENNKKFCATTTIL